MESDLNNSLESKPGYWVLPKGKKRWLSRGLPPRPLIDVACHWGLNCSKDFVSSYRHCSTLHRLLWVNKLQLILTDMELFPALSGHIQVLKNIFSKLKSLFKKYKFLIIFRFESQPQKTATIKNLKGFSIIFIKQQNIFMRLLQGRLNRNLLLFCSTGLPLAKVLDGFNQLA